MAAAAADAVPTTQVTTSTATHNRCVHLDDHSTVDHRGVRLHTIHQQHIIIITILITIKKVAVAVDINTDHIKCLASQRRSQQQQHINSDGVD